MMQVSKYIKIVVEVIVFSIALFITIGLADQKKELEKTIDEQQQILYDKEKEIDDMRVEVQRLNDLLYLEQQEKEEVNNTVKDSGVTTDTRTFEITHYTHTGNNTASGVYPVAGRTVACNSLPIGTVVEINGHNYVVEDRGGMAGNVIDVFVDTENEAIQKGRYVATVNIKG
jgi:3D (Asp-Asp-Asp) domain-containing protein|nr:MAG TPA: lytic transglycosylase [Caudoviricetes sp.]